MVAIHELPEEYETDSLDEMPLTAASHKPAGNSTTARGAYHVILTSVYTFILFFLITDKFHLKISA